MARALAVTIIAALAAGCGDDGAGATDARPADASVDADPCATLACECDTDADCTAAHEHCATGDQGLRTCECVAGYADGGAGCAWAGVVQDPGFQDAARWQTTGDARIVSDAPGAVEPGEVQYNLSALCNLGVVSQTFDMPTYARAEPLVVEVSLRNAYDPMTFDQILAGLGVGGGWSPINAPTGTGFRTVRLCLGEGGYAPAGTAGRGAPVTLSLAPFAKSLRCPAPSASLAFDHVAIVPARPGECAAPGLTPNGDAEADTGGYTFTVAGASGLAQGGYVAGLGSGGSRAARILLARRCDIARVAVAINVPTAATTPSPALELYWGATDGALIGGFFQPVVGTFNYPLSLPRPDGAARTTRICLPTFLRGQTTSFQLSLDGGAGACGTVVDRELWLDDVKVVNDPACGAGDALADPGFEAAPDLHPVQAVPPRWDARPIASPTAHGGSGVLELSNSERCIGPIYTFAPIVPPTSGTAGPALKFWHTMPVNPVSFVVVQPLGSPGSMLAEGTGWQERVVCLDRVYSGRPHLVRVVMDGGAGTCGPFGGVERAFLDDATVTTDPSCP